MRQVRRTIATGADQDDNIFGVTITNTHPVKHCPLEPFILNLTFHFHK